MLKSGKQKLYFINGFLLFLMISNTVFYTIKLYISSHEILSLDSYPEGIASILIVAYLCYANIKMKPKSMLISLFYMLSLSLADIYVSFYDSLYTTHVLFKSYWPFDTQGTIALLQIIFSTIVILCYSVCMAKSDGFYRRIL